jgi:protein tyrosine phosphatase (PTP) superfamily phosphohydrolase (DUF442 family)
MSRWWIDEHKLLGISNPTNRDLEDLYQEGFRTIISLLNEDEERPYYDIEKVEAIGFKRHSIPVKIFSTPKMADFREFLDTLDESIKQGKVLVHCQGGTGRTGTMAAAYWIRKGLSAREAIEKVRKSRPGAIEIPEQEESLFGLEASIGKETERNVGAERAGTR